MPSFDQLFGKLAIDREFVTTADVEKALRSQAARESPTFLGEVLIDMGRMTEAQVAEVLSTQGLEEEFREGGLAASPLPPLREGLPADMSRRSPERAKAEAPRAASMRAAHDAVLGPFYAFPRSDVW